MSPLKKTGALPLKNPAKPDVDPIALLKERQGDLTRWKFAMSMGVGTAYLSDMMHGRRDPGPKILEFLGLRKVVSYQFIEDHEPSAATNETSVTDGAET